MRELLCGLLDPGADQRGPVRVGLAVDPSGPAPVEVTTDKAPAHLRVLAELAPAAAHVTEQYADHGRSKARLHPMRGLKRLRPATVIAAGHAFVRDLRCGHYDLATDTTPADRLIAALTDLALTS